MSTVQTPAAAPPATKTCPSCGREIKSAAVVCRFCGSNFEAAPARAGLLHRRRARAAAKPKPSLLVLSFVNLHNVAALVTIVLAVAGLSATPSSPHWRYAATWQDVGIIHTFRIGVAAVLVPIVCLVAVGVQRRIGYALAAALWIAGAAYTAIAYVGWRNDATAPVTIQWTGYAIAAAFCLAVLAALALFPATMRRGGGEGREP